MSPALASICLHRLFCTKEAELTAPSSAAVAATVYNALDLATNTPPPLHEE